jgi:hypothetical protein
LPALLFEHHKRRISIKMEEINIKKRKYEDDEAEVHQPHKKRRKIEFDLSTNIDLPAEIMLEIFEKLSPTDFKTSLEVCKYWYECSTSYLGWTFVGETAFSLPPKDIEKVSRFAEVNAADGRNDDKLKLLVSTFYIRLYAGIAVQISDEQGSVIDTIYVIFGKQRTLIQVSKCLLPNSCASISHSYLLTAVKKFLGIWVPDLELKLTTADIYEECVLVHERYILSALHKIN